MRIRTFILAIFSIMVGAGAAACGGETGPSSGGGPTSYKVKVTSIDHAAPATAVRGLSFDLSGTGNVFLPGSTAYISATVSPVGIQSLTVPDSTTPPPVVQFCMTGPQVDSTFNCSTSVTASNQSVTLPWSINNNTAGGTYTILASVNGVPQSTDTVIVVDHVPAVILADPFFSGNMYGTLDADSTTGTLLYGGYFFTTTVDAATNTFTLVTTDADASDTTFTYSLIISNSDLSWADTLSNQTVPITLPNVFTPEHGTSTSNLCVTGQYLFLFNFSVTDSHGAESSRSPSYGMCVRYP